MAQLLVQRLHENARLPVKARHSDAGYDLHALHDVTLGTLAEEDVPEDKQLKLFKPVPRSSATHAFVHTGIAVAIPEGFYGRVAPRSGLSKDYYIETCAGVIDRGYRGEIIVHLVSHGGPVHRIKAGDRIAQLIITPYASPGVTEVASLPDSDRGTAGFGSSGR